MSSSKELYTRVIHTLSPLVSVAHIAHLTNWVWIVVGIVQANSIALSQIAIHIPGDAQAESRVTTIRRWLKNFRGDVWELYRPVLEHALQGWQSVTAGVIVDGVMVFGDRWQIFRLSLAHGGRAIPLVWLVLPGKGLTQMEKLEAMLTRAAAFLNGRVKRVIFLADADFRDCDWAQLCLKIETVARIPGMAKFLKIPGRFRGIFCIKATTPGFVTTVSENRLELRHSHRGQHLCDLEQRVVRSDSSLGRQIGPTPLLSAGLVDPRPQAADELVGDLDPRDEKHLPELLALISDQPAARARLRDAKRAVRMHIEEMFGDWKDHGWELETTHLRHPARLSRLVLALALLYVCLVLWGGRLIKAGCRAWVDRSDQRDLRLFRIGLDMLHRCFALIRELPVPAPSLVHGPSVR